VVRRPSRNPRTGFGASVSQLRRLANAIRVVRGPFRPDPCRDRRLASLRYRFSRKAEVSKSRQPSKRSRFFSPNSRASFLAKRSLFKSTRADHFKSASGTRSGLAMAHGPARQRTLPGESDRHETHGRCRQTRGSRQRESWAAAFARSGASLRQTPTHPTRIDVTSIASRAAAGNRLFPARSRRIWLIY
jgi:hypothetical protein